MSGQTSKKLVLMMNQIARNMQFEGDPAAAVADHVAAFWTRRMQEMILAHGDEGIEPIARAALKRLAARRGSAPGA